MMRQFTALAAAGSLAIGGCTTTEGQTTAEGAALGALAGALLGGAIGGRDGALKGAAIGGLAGVAAGSYVANQKKKYATIERRIEGERQIVLAATENAHAQVANSQAQLRVLEAQLADLTTKRQNRQGVRAATSTMLTSLGRQRSQLETQLVQLSEQIKNQQDFLADTEQEVRKRRTSARAAELAQWRADIPMMEAALTSMNNQIGEVRTMEERVTQVRAARA